MTGDEAKVAERQALALERIATALEVLAASPKEREARDAQQAYQQALKDSDVKLKAYAKVDNPRHFIQQGGTLLRVFPCGTSTTRGTPASSNRRSDVTCPRCLEWLDGILR